ncbi:MAG: TRAP transporter permease DctQ [Desulfotalea sp.]|nr:MAG: TRAP transporter permease DctQ [Desulfotalea sp.]
MFNLHWISEHVEELLGASLLAVMACLAFANVITRYVFQYPLAFTEELEINALVWLTLFGTASAFRRRKHLSMLFFQDKLPECVRGALKVMIPLLAIGLFASLGYLGYLQIVDERFLEITSESLGAPQWLYTLCIPVGCGMIVFRIIQASVREMKETK